MQKWNEITSSANSYNFLGHQWIKKKATAAREKNWKTLTLQGSHTYDPHNFSSSSIHHEKNPFHSIFSPIFSLIFPFHFFFFSHCSHHEFSSHIILAAVFCLPFMFNCSSSDALKRSPTTTMTCFSLLIKGVVENGRTGGKRARDELDSLEAAELNDYHHRLCCKSEECAPHSIEPWLNNEVHVVAEKEKTR